MLTLLLKLEEKVFAIPARAVLEVVPKVQLRAAPEASDWVSGLFAYRGAIMPVVDLCMRVEGRPCRGFLSSRIIVVRRGQGASSSAFGILSENVTDVRDLAADKLVRVQATMASYVAGTILSDGELIHLLDVNAVLPERLDQARQLPRET